LGEKRTLKLIFEVVCQPKIGHRIAKIGHRSWAVFPAFGSTKIGHRMLQFGHRFSVRQIWKTFNFFTIFRFELGLGVNMKVVGIEVSFLMALFW